MECIPIPMCSYFPIIIVPQYHPVASFESPAVSQARVRNYDQRQWMVRDALFLYPSTPHGMTSAKYNISDHMWNMNLLAFLIVHVVQKYNRNVNCIYRCTLCVCISISTPPPLSPFRYPSLPIFILLYPSPSPYYLSPSEGTNIITKTCYYHRNDGPTSYRVRDLWSLSWDHMYHILHLKQSPRYLITKGDTRDETNPIDIMSCGYPLCSQAVGFMQCEWVTWWVPTHVTPPHITAPQEVTQSELYHTYAAGLTVFHYPPDYISHP